MNELKKLIIKIKYNTGKQALARLNKVTVEPILNRKLKEIEKGENLSKITDL